MIEGKYKLPQGIESSLQKVIKTFPDETIKRGINSDLYAYRYTISKIYPFIHGICQNKLCRIIDIGSGAGIIPLVLKMHFQEKVQILCVDNWEEYDMQFNNQMGGNYDILDRFKRIDIATQKCDLERETFSYDQNFSICLLLNVIEHLLYPQKILREIHESLEVGGYLLLTTPNGAHLKGRIMHLIGRSPHPDPIERWYYGPFFGHYREFTVSEMCKMIKWSGFRIVCIETSNSWHFWTRYKDRTYTPGIDFKSKDWPIKLIYFILTSLIPSLRFGMLVIAQKVA